MRRVVVGLALGGAVVTTLPVAAHADEIDDRVAEVRELLKSGNDASLSTCVASLAKVKDARAAEALLLVARSHELGAAAEAAMRALGARHDLAFVAWAKSKLSDEKLLEERPARLKVLLESLEAAGDASKPCLRSLGECVASSMTSKPDVAQAGVRAIAAIRSEKATIDQLIALLEKVEKSERGGGGGGGARGGLTVPPPTNNSGGGGGGVSPQAVKEQILASLKDLTAGTSSTADGWKSWWTQNKAAWKPKPAPVPERDWDALEEFVDDDFGFSLRRPPGDKRWKFAKSEGPGGRVRLALQGPRGPLALLEASTSAKGPFVNASAYAQHLQGLWRMTEFSDFLDGGEPGVEIEQLGGRECAVIRARGAGAGPYDDWGGCERRAYVVPLDGKTYLRVDAVVRISAEQGQQDALWAAVQGMSFPAAK